MPKAFLFTTSIPTTGSQPLVAYDPLTGESEVIVDHFVPDDPDAFDIELPVEFPEAPPRPSEPFRAIVVPRRLYATDRDALRPGTRARLSLPAIRPAFEPFPGGVTPRLQRPEIPITDFPIRAQTTGAQPLECAREVLQFDELTVELRVLSLIGAAADVTVELQTGMQLESTAGWVSAGAFARVTTAPSIEVKSFTGLLRFIRWNVADINGTSATFYVSALGRRWSKEN